jgi:hypothetical protein
VTRHAALLPSGVAGLGFGEEKGDRAVLVARVKEARA